ncbi:MAG: hypothetical protein CMG59_05695 [Candidatus Marinimicrobia bacterium]|nr:hypothetical protein [Candidatus Neomarinimicrobiota bacterium]
MIFQKITHLKNNMKIKLPELGEGIESVEVTDVFVSVDNLVKKDDIIIVVESDKASMEIPTKLDGKILSINVKKGDEIKPGDLILELSDSTSSQTVTKSEPSSTNIDLNVSNSNDNINNDDTEYISLEESKSIYGDGNFEPTHDSSAEQQQIDPGLVVATPSVKKFARELGCDLSKVHGSAKNGRITREDILNFVKGNQNKPSEKAEKTFDDNESQHDKDNLVSELNQTNIKPKSNTQVELKSSSNIQIDDNKLLKYGSIEKVLFNKIRTLTAERMVDSWNTIPHVTHFDEIEIDHILNLKKDIELATESKKVSILTFISRALIDSISKMEKFNSIPDMENNVLIVKKYINLGIAVDTSNGLVVPNIKNAEKLSIKELNDSIIDISHKARNRNLTPSDITEGSFTISSLGGIGGRYFTPIINKPEVAIMGLSRTFKKVYLDNSRIPYEVNILPFSLSYDHRVIDGAEAAKFCNLFKKNLKNLSING